MRREARPHRSALCLSAMSLLTPSSGRRGAREAGEAARARTREGVGLLLL
jgi:hypothetical protein